MVRVSFDMVMVADTSTVGWDVIDSSYVCGCGKVKIVFKRRATAWKEMANAKAAAELSHASEAHKVEAKHLELSC